MAHSSNEYQRNYLNMWRSHRKAKHTLQDNWEKDTEAKYIKEPTGDFEESNRISLMNQATYGGLYRTAKAVRELDNLDDVNRIYQELWKELEVVKAKLWEA
jgi:hypothetical protein